MGSRSAGADGQGGRRRSPRHSRAAIFTAPVASPARAAAPLEPRLAERTRAGMPIRRCTWCGWPTAHTNGSLDYGSGEPSRIVLQYCHDSLNESAESVQIPHVVICSDEWEGTPLSMAGGVQPAPVRTDPPRRVLLAHGATSRPSGRSGRRGVQEAAPTRLRITKYLTTTCPSRSFTA